MSFTNNSRVVTLKIERSLATGEDITFTHYDFVDLGLEGTLPKHLARIKRHLDQLLPWLSAPGFKHVYNFFEHLDAQQRAAQLKIAEAEIAAHEAERAKKLDAYFAVLSRTVQEHVVTLQRKRSQMVRLDDYGKEVGLQAWTKEVTHFLTHVVPRPDGIVVDLSECLRRVDSEILSSVAKQPLRRDVSAMAGIEYEVHCQEILQGLGLTVFRKGQTGDQGVDLLVPVGEHRVAIQCKRYAKPVGNKAVQEVAAGKGFEKCDLAVVVSSSRYTPAAERLAASLGVVLLADSQLNDFVEIVNAAMARALG